METTGPSSSNRTPPAPDGSKGVFFIAISQFGLAFSFNVVMSFMPFYIIRISPYNPTETMVWIGLIMGLNSFVAAAAAPFWGSMIARFRPKVLFQGAFLAGGITFLLMGFTDSLPVLLLLRLLQGALGGASTIGIYMIMQLSAKERLSGNLSMYQNAMTAGQLLGPPVGAYAASAIGYRPTFVLSFLLISGFLVLCHIFIIEIQKKTASLGRKSQFNKALLWGWALSLIATIHLTYLPSILPHVLEGFHLVGESALRAAGLIIMGYTATAIIGNFIIGRLATESRFKGVIAALCLASALLQLLLYFPGGVIGFTAIRMLQTGIIAAVIPLLMASLASRLGGAGIGFLNSARFAGNGVGPLMATFVLAGSNLLTLYLMIVALTVLFVLAYWVAGENPAR